MASNALKGKLAIVTGASKLNGVGFATAKALAEQGADIVLHYNSNKESALKAADLIKQLGVHVLAVQADASTLTYGTDLVEATRAAFPGRTIDILINNAGTVTLHATLAEIPAEEFDFIFHINVRSIFLLIQAAEPYLTAPGARIVNVGSVVARVGSGPASFYAGSKAALHALTRSWAELLGPKGITANVALLGPIQTDMVFPDDAPELAVFRANQYVKRNGTPKEVADAIVFLASPGTSFISGEVLAIDGGMTHG